jgi:hypothetical protein
MARFIQHFKDLIAQQLVAGLACAPKCDDDEATDVPSASRGASGT